MSLSVRQLQFLQFMSGSMEALVQTLSPDQFQHTRLGFPRSEEFELVSRWVSTPMIILTHLKGSMRLIYLPEIGFIIN